MNRTRRLTALAFLVAPALAASPATAAHAWAAVPPGAVSLAACHVETDSAGRYHLWGEGFPGDMRVSYSGSSPQSSAGTVATDSAGRFDLGGLSGGTFVVTTADGKTQLTCATVHH
ncbi:hypothetical protein ABZ646_06635 [Streptomyces sp. NPDC007162]|uniref:hypothetical protein n=1 Tax=Streptomyces sp. NPDC007162 TaxID=3156917 RepID=UPI0034081BC0